MNKLKVLIVEDQPFQREYLKGLFKAQGVFQLEAASDGQEALNFLSHKVFDLILSDLMMPGLDGVQFIQELSKFDDPPKLALMSSSSRRMLGGACMLAEMLGLDVIDRISKPAMPESIKQLLTKLLLPILPAADKANEAWDFTDDMLREAVMSGECQAWFQPKKSLSNGKIGSAEALVRWVHPELGMLHPGQFLDRTKSLGLEESLLFSMVKQTITAQHAWLCMGYRIPVSINLPTHLLNDPALPDRLHDFVLSLGGIPGSLSFELTECSMTDLLSNYIAGVCRLRMMGYGLAQDDFGQGFSSFFNLVKTPFTELKIDRELIANCETDESTAVALKSIISLGRKLGLEVVAEGVENYQQLELLREFDCNTVQGYLISKAVSRDAFLQLLKEDG